MINWSKYISMPAIIIFVMGGASYYVASKMMSAMVELYGESPIESFAPTVCGIFIVMGIAVWYMDIKSNPTTSVKSEDL